MLNLLRFKPDGGQRALRRVRRRGRRRCWRRPAAAPSSSASRRCRCSATGRWDSVLLVEYPTRQAFLDMIASAEYQAIGHLRTEALEHGELHPMSAADQLP